MLAALLFGLLHNDTGGEKGASIKEGGSVLTYLERKNAQRRDPPCIQGICQW